VSDPKPASLRRRMIVFGAAFLLFALLVTAFFGRKGLLDIVRIRKKYEALVQDVDRLQKEKTRLEKEIAALEQDPRAVDKEARDKLWLMKPDEKAIVRTKK
jgi:cell division protein FtsB